MGARVDAISSSALMFLATFRLSRAAIALTTVLSGTGGLYINAPWLCQLKILRQNRAGVQFF